MGSYAMMISWSYCESQQALWIFSTVQRDVLLLFLVPVLVLWILQQRLEMLRPLTTMDMVQGVVGEMATIPVWEKLATKEGRKLNLGMAIYYLLLWTPLLSIAIFVPINPPSVEGKLLLPTTNSTTAATTMGNKQLLSSNTSFALVCLLSGGSSLPLFLYQVPNLQWMLFVIFHCSQLFKVFDYLSFVTIHDVRFVVFNPLFSGLLQTKVQHLPQAKDPLII